MHWNFVAQPFGIIAGTIGRISFSVSLLRITGPADKPKKSILYFVIIFQILVNASTIILIYVQCGKNIDAIWDPSLIKTAGAKCWSPDVQTFYGFFQSCEIFIDAESLLPFANLLFSGQCRDRPGLDNSTVMDPMEHAVEASGEGNSGYLVGSFDCVRLPSEERAVNTTNFFDRAMAATVVKTYQLKNISARNDFTSMLNS